ncbi:putative Uncharacterized MFS-type transporter C16A3.17c [Glarea lozoyensis 74030]|uniref:Putative Uncharacterized MFS-type transporter C16A3.17c n=1 Tax=Glarea lozoyensis (strain ATCC 74030 / MF5533) TaxID=1104152 RepID=H0EFH2_GLAL7|nr:putative Uncharacterized MFS-type transporter C16A3.17c [Glarea lozoyensis 74030]
MSDLAGAQERLPKSGMSDQQPTQTSEEESKVEVGNNAEAKETETFRLSWDVGGVFFALLVLSLMSSIDATIVTTSLPTIAREIGGGAEYILYFQAVKGVSPLDSGVYYLPFALAIIPFGGMGAAFISKTGQYIPLHGIGFALSAIGTGLFSILDEDSSPGAWIGFQIIASGGSGLVFTSTLISTLAPLPEEDVAIATGTYSFIRSFGFVWGLTIASVAFNSQIDRYLGIVDDEVVRSLMANGRAYAFATRGTFDALTAITRSQVTEVYVKALRMIWIIVAAFSCFGFFCIFAEKHVKLRKEKGNEFGLGEKKPKPVECEDGKIQ